MGNSELKEDSSGFTVFCSFEDIVSSLLAEILVVVEVIVLEHKLTKSPAKCRNFFNNTNLGLGFFRQSVVSKHCPVTEKADLCPVQFDPF
jgi:hypothetical protein